MQELCKCKCHESYKFWRQCCGRAGIQKVGDGEACKIPQAEASSLSDLLACAEYHELRASEPLLTLEGMKECQQKEDLKKCLPIWTAKSKAKHLNWAKLLRELATS